MQSEFAQLTGLGGTDEIGASGHLYRFAGLRVLIDAGARPNRGGEAGLIDLATLDALSPSAMLLTHAHYDHVGSLPRVIAQHPGLNIHASDQTIALTRVVLEDALKVGKLQGNATFDENMLKRALQRFIPVRGNFTLDGRGHRVQVTPQRAGHLLGALSFTLEHSGGGTVHHSGDVNHQDTPSTLKMDAPLRPVDAFVSESTYGNRELPSRASQVTRLAKQVRQTLTGGGWVLIPSFALGRSQDLSWTLQRLMRQGLIPRCEVMLDGLVREATRVYEAHHAALPPQTRFQGGRQPFSGGAVMMDRRSRDAFLKKPRPAVVIASSGMLSAGVSPLYAEVLLRDARNLLLIVGYQDAESPGRALQGSRTRDTVTIGSGKTARKVQLECSVDTLAISAHAGAAQLTAHVLAHEPASCVLVHGDAPARRALARTLLAQGVDTQLPALKETVVFRRRSAHPAAVTRADHASSPGRQQPPEKMTDDRNPPVSRPSQQPPSERAATPRPSPRASASGDAPSRSHDERKAKQDRPASRAVQIDGRERGSPTEFRSRPGAGPARPEPSAPLAGQAGGHETLRTPENQRSGPVLSDPAAPGKNT